MAYSEKVLEHYEKPRNIGSLDTGSNRVGSALVGAPECGDVMKLQIEVDENEKIVDAKFKTFGCGSAIASSSLATEWVKGKSLMKQIQFRMLTLWKNFLFPLSRFIALFWRKMLLREQLMIIERKMESQDENI